jgi:flagellar motor switch protein FliM
LGRELRQTDIDIEVVLNEKAITLGDVMNFKVGSTLLLDCRPDDEVMIKCGGVDITTGKLGRVDNKIAVAISEPVKRKAKESA